MRLNTSKKVATISFIATGATFFIVLIALLIGWVILPGQFSNSMSNKLLVSVNIRHIPFSFNPLGIDHVSIGNPKEYNDLQKALTVGSIRVMTPVKNYFEEQIVIDEILIDTVYLGIQFESLARLDKGNWSQIASNLKQTSSSDEKRRGKEGRNPSILIKKVVIRNVQAELLYGHDRKKAEKLPLIKEMTFTDLNSDEGAPMGQILNSILAQMIITTTAQKQIDVFKNLFNLPGKAGNVLEKAGEGLEKLKQGLLKQ